MTAAVLTCAVTGPIATKADNPNLPVTPEAIAESARAAHEAGAAVVHIHVRDEQGSPTADLEIARRTDRLIEEACPVLVQLSTGVGLDVPFEEREQLVEARLRMASLNPEMELAWTGFDTGSGDNPLNTSIRTKWRPEIARQFHDQSGIDPDELFPVDDLFVMHKVPFRHEITHVENLGGDLAAAGTRRCLIGAFPIPIVGGEASPCRVVAFVDE